MDDFLHRLEKDTVHRVRQIEAAEPDVLKRSFALALALSEANARLKEFILGYTFRDEAEEIYFFKRVKPHLVSHMIYHRKVYNMEINRPVGGVELQREFLNNELADIQYFINRRQEFYIYYRLGHTHWDDLYFTREKRCKAEMGQYLEAGFGDREPAYSTSCDYKLAELMANERLEALLKYQLDALENRNKEELPTLPWVVKKTFLIELLYALDSAGVFGSIPLSRVVEVVEKVLGIKLGNVSASFNEMRTRNEATPFLDMLKETLLMRMKRKNNKKRG